MQTREPDQFRFQGKTVQILADCCTAQLQNMQDISCDERQVSQKTCLQSLVTHERNWEGVEEEVQDAENDGSPQV